MFAVRKPTFVHIWPVMHRMGVLNTSACIASHTQGGRGFAGGWRAPSNRAAARSEFCGDLLRPLGRGKLGPAGFRRHLTMIPIDKKKNKEQQWSPYWWTDIYPPMVCNECIWIIGCTWWIYASHNLFQQCQEPHGIFWSPDNKEVDCYPKVSIPQKHTPYFNFTSKSGSSSN